MTWFDSEQLVTFGADALQKVGIREVAARLTAHSLVVADQRGTFSHGMLRLPLYVAAIEQGGINADPQMHWVSERGATALLDADAGLGQLAMREAVERVCRLTDEYGVGVVAVQGSSHFGAGSYWAKQLTDLGYLAFVTSTTGPTVAPFGGAEKVLGTNPLTLGAPASGDEELMVDLATSTGAYGKVIAARNAGTEIPDGWAVDAYGQPTRDPQAAMAGALTPFGGHKGSAVASAVEAFSVILGSATYAFETEDIWSNPGSRMNIGHLIVAINSDFFAGRDATEMRTATLLARIRGSAGDAASALAPGDPEREHQHSAGDLVELKPSDVEGLRALAERLDLLLPTPAE